MASRLSHRLNVLGAKRFPGLGPVSLETWAEAIFTGTRQSHYDMGPMRTWFPIIMSKICITASSVAKTPLSSSRQAFSMAQCALLACSKQS